MMEDAGGLLSKFVRAKDLVDQQIGRNRDYYECRVGTSPTYQAWIAEFEPINGPVRDDLTRAIKHLLEGRDPCSSAVEGWHRPDVIALICNEPTEALDSRLSQILGWYEPPEIRHRRCVEQRIRDSLELLRRRVEAGQEVQRWLHARLYYLECLVDKCPDISDEALTTLNQLRMYSIKWKKGVEFLGGDIG